MKKGEEPNAENAVSKVNDAVGIRVITSFVDDIYKVSDWITLQNDIEVVNIKDYIAYPKPNGYRSYHMIIHLNDLSLNAEIQIRTIALDFWANLEHQMKYAIFFLFSFVSNWVIRFFNCSSAFNKTGYCSL